MLKLRAAVDEDGYAFVQAGETLYLIRPPFRSEQKLPVSQTVLEKAICDHGFQSIEEEFKDWASLIERLSERLVEARKARGETPDTERIRRLMQRAPLEKVVEFLDRAENQLLPRRELNAADSLLRNLLKNKEVLDDPALLDRCTDLLAQCGLALKEEEKAKLSWSDSNLTLEEEFPRLAKHGQKFRELARQVEKYGLLQHAA